MTGEARAALKTLLTHLKVQNAKLHESKATLYENRRKWEKDHPSLTKVVSTEALELRRVETIEKWAGWIDAVEQALADSAPKCDACGSPLKTDGTCTRTQCYNAE